MWPPVARLTEQYHGITNNAKDARHKNMYSYSWPFLEMLVLLDLFPPSD